MWELALDWLLAPIEPSRAHLVDGLTSWHVRLMVLAWGVSLPLGVPIARYFKVLPSQDWPRELDNKTWWRGHLFLQWGGAVLTLFGFGQIIAKVGKLAFADSPHHVLGWVTICLLGVQVLGGVFRGSTGGPARPASDGSLHGDHFDMTLRRKVFVVVHKMVGYLALLLGAATITSGLWMANAPVWMWISIGGWWMFLIGAAVMFQRQRRSIDTYQAIWGPSLELPGNKIRPIGFGIYRRPE